MSARVRRFIDDWAWYWTGGTHVRGLDCGPLSTRSWDSHTQGTMQYSQERGARDSLKE